jgi:hypothetical protein
MAYGQHTVSFTVPAGAGSYAPEVLKLRQQQDRGTGDDVSELTLMVETLPTAALIEVDLLRPGGNLDGGDSHFILAVQSHNAVGLKAILQLAAWKGGRVRAKSGGNAGSSIVHAAWW